MDLSCAQKDAINHIQGPALVLAVPGAGKTTVLLHRTAKLIEDHKVKASRILSITFSKAASIDMKERFNRDYPSIGQGVDFSTIHSLAFTIVRDYAVKNNIRLMLIESSKSKISKTQLLRDLYYSYNNKAISEEKMDTLNSNISYVKNMLLGPEEIKTDVEGFRHIFKAYENFKLEEGLIDFDDMLTICLKALREDGQILSKYRNKYDYIQVDEAQDTSKVQIEIINLLASPKNNLFIVADDDQSIYGFRGAYPDELFKFKSKYKSSKIFYMEKNYRSTEEIVKLSKDFISQNKKRYRKDIYTDKKSKDKVRLIKTKNLRDQYEFLVEDLKRIDDLETTAILYRNNLSSIGIIDVLDKNNISFSTRDTNLKFFNHFIIRDIVNFFTLAKNPSDVFAFEKIYYKMKGFISRKQLNYIKGENYQESVFQRLLSLPDLNGFYRNNFNELEGDFSRLNKLNFRSGVEFVKYELEYMSHLEDYSHKFGQNMTSIKNILELIQVIGNDSRGIDDFLERIDHLEAIVKSKSSGVNLSTLHGSKGLEFDNVYIVDLIEGSFPSQSVVDRYNKGELDQYEEERRLMYVGMTRAKKNLNLITSRDRSSLYGQSEFIEEIKDFLD